MKSRHQRSKYPSTSSNIFLYSLHYLLRPTTRLLIHRLFSQTTRPILRRATDFSPAKTISIRRGDRRHTYVMQFSPWTRRSTLLSWKLAARGVHSGRLLHGTMAAVGFKTGLRTGGEGETCRFSLLNAWELSRSARNSWKSGEKVCLRSNGATHATA